MNQPDSETLRAAKQKLKDVIYNILVCDFGLKKVSDKAENVAEVTLLKLHRIAASEQYKEMDKKTNEQKNNKSDSQNSICKAE